MRKEQLQSLKSDPVEFRESYDRDLGPVGPVTVHCANFGLVAGLIQHGEATQVTIILGAPGCPCGCGSRGVAFEYRPSTENARILANNLIEVCDEIDRIASERATQLLERVRKGDRS